MTDNMRHIKERQSAISTTMTETQDNLKQLTSERDTYKACVAHQEELSLKSAAMLTHGELTFLDFMAENAGVIADRLEVLPDEITLKEDNLIMNMSCLSGLAKERGNVKKNITEVKKERRKTAKQFQMFGNGFRFHRPPEFYAQELWAAIFHFERVNLHATLNKLKDFSTALMHQYQSDDPKFQNNANLSTMADKWVKTLEAAAGAEGGLTRKRFMEIMLDHVPDDCDLRDALETMIEDVKRDEPDLWASKLSLSRHGAKKEEKKEAAAAKSTASTGPPAGFLFRNIREYRAANACTLTPAFPRPANLDPRLKEWCSVHCYSEHKTAQCHGGNKRRNEGRRGSGGGGFRREKSRSRSRSRSRRREKSPRRKEKREKRR